MLGTSLWLGKNASVVHAADENVNNDDGIRQTTEAGKSALEVDANTKVEVQPVQAKSIPDISGDQNGITKNNAAKEQVTQNESVKNSRTREQGNSYFS